VTHPTDDDHRLHGALEQDRREHDWDRDWGPIEALRETRQLGPVVGCLLIAAIGVYIGAWTAGNGDVLGGLVIGALAIVGGGLWLDIELCSGTPAHVHECRRCRRETDRWRGPTRDDLRATSLVGQRSAAPRTPAASLYGRVPPEPREWPEELKPAVRRTDPPTEPQELYPTVPAASRSRRGGVAD
jgi:hypothetical protein